MKLRKQAIKMLQEGISAKQVYEETGFFIDDKGRIRNDTDDADGSDPAIRKPYPVENLKRVKAEAEAKLEAERELPKSALPRYRPPVNISIADFVRFCQYRLQKHIFWFRASLLTPINFYDMIVIGSVWLCIHENIRLSEALPSGELSAKLTERAFLSLYPLRHANSATPLPMGEAFARITSTNEN